MTNEKGITYFSTFSGIGGFELGIQGAHRWVQKQRQTDIRLERARPEARHSAGKHHTLSKRPDRHALDRSRSICVGYSEIDKYAAQIYQSHFPDHHNYGDITKINADALPDFDLYVGGFPCQAFSIAGKRAGFNDTRGTLFFEVARILKAKRPKHFMLENVKGLLSHDDGRTFKTIISTLVELGYGVEWQVLNSKDFGVPQNRERVFIVGHLGGQCAHQVFPLGEDSNAEIIQEGPKRPVAGTLSTKNQSPQCQFDGSTTLIAKTVRSGGRSSPHGSKQNWNSYEFEGNIRRLTPVECERLQGFPDGWTEGVSDTQRYKTLGNAVTVNVIEAVISALYN